MAREIRFICFTADFLAGSNLDESVSVILAAVRTGDQESVRQLFQRFFGHVAGMARERMSPGVRRVHDEEDVALSVMDSFFGGVAAGKFASLTNRNELIRLLLVITTRKAADYANREHALKRGGGAVRGESVFRNIGSDVSGGGLQNQPARVLTPEEDAATTDVVHRLLEALESDQLRAIAVMKMDGYSDVEIATEMNCTRSTINRKLQLIRGVWEREIE